MWDFKPRYKEINCIYFKMAPMYMQKHLECLIKYMFKANLFYNVAIKKYWCHDRLHWNRKTFIGRILCTRHSAILFTVLNQVVLEHRVGTSNLELWKWRHGEFLNFFLEDKENLSFIFLSLCSYIEKWMTQSWVFINMFE